MTSGPGINVQSPAMDSSGRNQINSAMTPCFVSTQNMDDDNFQTENS